MSDFLSSLWASAMKPISPFSSSFNTNNHSSGLAVTNIPKSDDFQPVHIPSIFNQDRIVIINDANGIKLSCHQPEEYLPQTADESLYMFEATKINVVTMSTKLNAFKSFTFRNINHLNVTVHCDGTNVLKTFGECCTNSMLSNLKIATVSSVSKLETFETFFKLFPHLKNFEISLNMFYNVAPKDWIDQLVAFAPMKSLQRVVINTDNIFTMKFEAESINNLMKIANVGFKLQINLSFANVSDLCSDLRHEMMSLKKGCFTTTLESGTTFIVATFQKVDDVQSPAEWLNELAFEGDFEKKVFITFSAEFFMMLRCEDFYRIFKNAKINAILELKLHLTGKTEATINTIEARMAVFKNLPFFFSMEKNVKDDSFTLQMINK